ncbi:actin [Oopsacas minuta]|uniref:Actin n=1 Tax=Oopsacas minuta TaxID=111878 RepID=A0AAV7K5I1_9METZ|nr:actin [Oopsacas minuta]
MGDKLDEYNSTPIVVDNGSDTCKAGFAGEYTPRAEFPSTIGRPRMRVLFVGMEQMSSFAGQEAINKRGILSLKYPIEHGIVTNWDDMEKLWNHTFYNELRVAPEEHPILLTETPLNPKVYREKMLQIMFETFNTPALYISNNQVLSLYSKGYTTGLVVDSGKDSSHIVPIYKGHVLKHSVVLFEIGGRVLAEYLAKLLTDTGYNMRYERNANIVNDIKEKLAFVSRMRVENDPNNHKDKSFTTEELLPVMYALPDGQEIAIREECLRCPEALFNPSLIGSVHDGIHVDINKSILKSDTDIHHHLYTNIVLAGGNTMFPGIEERLYTELSVLTPNIKSIKIRAAPDRKYSAWIGGSMLASSDAFDKICLTKYSYDEYGPEIILRKCL